VTKTVRLNDTMTAIQASFVLRKDRELCLSCLLTTLIHAMQYCTRASVKQPFCFFGKFVCSILRCRRRNPGKDLFFNRGITLIDAVIVHPTYIFNRCMRIRQLFSHGIAVLTLRQYRDLDQRDYFQNPLHVCIHNCPVRG